jgi:hypothetical protein
VEREIRPEPTELERGAIEQALERTVAGDSVPPGYRSPWRLAGLEEATQQDETEP